MRIQYEILGVVFFLIITSCASDPVTAPNPSKASLFAELQQNMMSSLVIETDLSRLRDKSDSTDYQPAALSLDHRDSTLQEFAIEVKPRGVTRKRICTLPPIKIKFAKTDLEESGLEPYNKLKLVLPCHEGEDYRQLLLKEFLTYKIYNTLTDRSFKVQLAEITFVDSDSLIPSYTDYGFLIENEEEMSNRLQASLVKKSVGAIKSIDANQYQLFTVYQYMIGNTDWNLSRQHNLKIIEIGDSLAPIPIPYDFDFSGLVNAPYAKPYPTLPIKNVKDRFFQFRSKKEVDFTPVLNLFKEKKQEIMRLCEEYDMLEKSMQEEMKVYLESFFERIKSMESWNEVHTKHQ